MSVFPHCSKCGGTPDRNGTCMDCGQRPPRIPESFEAVFYGPQFGHPDSEMAAKDARIADLENQIRKLQAEIKRERYEPEPIVKLEETKCPRFSKAVPSTLATASR